MTMKVRANDVELSPAHFPTRDAFTKKPGNLPGAVNDSPPREKLCAAGCPNRPLRIKCEGLTLSKTSPLCPQRTTVERTLLDSTLGGGPSWFGIFIRQEPTP
jgi:hypothetical protein